MITTAELRKLLALVERDEFCPASVNWQIAREKEILKATQEIFNHLPAVFDRLEKLEAVASVARYVLNAQGKPHLPHELLHLERALEALGNGR